jgi:hypothetical protein
MERTLPLIKNVINKEIAKLNENSEYWGTSENIENENEIFNYALTYEIVNQDWFDERLKYTNVELLSEILNKLTNKKFYWNNETLEHFKFQSNYQNENETIKEITLFVENECDLEENETVEMLVNDIKKQINKL